MWQMVEMHEMVPSKLFDRYHELGQHAFGEKLGLWIVVPQQLVCEVGVDIVYMVTVTTRFLPLKFFSFILIISYIHSSSYLKPSGIIP
ncbi:putative amino acid transporter, transmembrane domain-containing protein [Lupinus albus]|uniref:Putative amino acid transporter, transmembrane domain-containing protein n=1 Tax=Lupinus albus TaxID=3870 RepID=A0A6A4N2Z3_LUPAL|nr:putative amino acid transporter, transmembrane domain-containing protein [Lupinus albus]